GPRLSMWQQQVEVLRQRWRVLRYDTRGHGGSTIDGTGADAAYTLQQLGADVIGLMDRLEIGRAHFCGISMGGITGLWLGLHAPQRLLSLTVANSAARIGNAQGWDARAQQVVEQGMAALAAGASARWFTDDFVARSPALVKRMTEQLAASSANGYAACCRALAEADLRADLARIPVPTLVIAGRDDPVTTVDDARFVSQRVPGARLVELQASHLSNIEAADAFTLALSQQLG
ncbi:alpha/beta fold hydrolase, partial [Herbaspirillum sp. YR522]|uniref:alpha/beta fold hydrolase n=1 Tax=Herbaspirillum sp. YR522 TaxID=1144342 RepID=UPI00026F53C2